MMDILNRLNEAIERGFWDPDGDILEKLEELYLKTEETIEMLTDR